MGFLLFLLLPLCGCFGCLRLLAGLWFCLWRHLHLHIVFWFGCGFLFSFFLFSCIFFSCCCWFFIVSLGTVFCCFWVAGRILAFPVDWATAPLLIAVLSAGAGDIVVQRALGPWSDDKVQQLQLPRRIKETLNYHDCQAIVDGVAKYHWKYHDMKLGRISSFSSSS